MGGGGGGGSGGGFFSPSIPPSVPTTYSSNQTLPDWYTSAQQDELANLGIAQGAAAPYYGEAANEIGYARNTLGNTIDPALNKGVFASYMDPFTSGVVNQIQTLGNRNLTENILPAVNDTFTGAGQFGGNRNAEFENRAIRDTQQAEANAEAGALEQGFNTSMAGYNAGQQRAQNASQIYSTLANTAANLGNAQLNPTIAAGNVINGMKVPVSISGVQNGPLPGAQYGPSPAAGLVSAANAIPGIVKAVNGVVGGGATNTNPAGVSDVGTIAHGGHITEKKYGALGGAKSGGALVVSLAAKRAEKKKRGGALSKIRKKVA